MSQEKQVDIKIYCGEDYDSDFILREPGSSVIRDLTGATVTSQLRKYPSGRDPIDFIVTSYGSSGRIRMQMTSEQTGTLSYAYGQYTVDVLFPGRATPETVLWGRVFILPNVTKIKTGTPQIVLAYNSFDEFPEIGTYFRLYLDIKAALLYRWNGNSYENALIGLKGDSGNNGRGITGVSKISTTNLTDKYEISYSDGTHSYFYVTNGSSIAAIEKSGSAGLIDTYTVTLSDGSTTQFEVRNGAGIASIVKTDVDGKIDTYTITLDNTETATFQVHNGEDGIGCLVYVDQEIAYVTTLDAYVNSIIAPEFDDTTSYSIGDFCMYQNVLYEFTANHQGDWDAAHVTATTVTELIRAAMS